MVFMPRQNARMRNSSLTCALAVWLLAGACGTLLGAESAGPGLVFACAADNDLYAVLAANGVVCPRYDSPAAALAAADAGAGVLLLADGYPLNSGFLGLHEAAAATGDPRLRQAEDRMAAFLCRIQTQSEIHPDLDGTWFRAFDFGRWDYWASNADLGWGAWCVETGWVQGWLVTTFALRQLQTSLWDLTTRRPLTRHLEKNLKQLSLDTEPES